MASPSAVGRRRGLPKQMSSEDQALNLIAKEAEARLAAKRAARAEARSIRMKELEMKQKEAEEEYDTEDGMKKRSSSSRSNGENFSNLSITTDAQYMQLKEMLRETEDKYRKAMINNAQLDNERQALQYQVERLKDVIEELEENLENVTDELMHKTKEHNKLSREHANTEEELQKCKTLLADRERILDEHNINLDGTLKGQDGPDGNEAAVASHHSHGSLSNHIGYSSEDVTDRELLLSEIQSLKEEVAELRRENETENPRRGGADNVKIERADLERSFVDVSTEAAAIRDDARHTGLYVNNNEKCDDFEVIDDGSQQGGIRHFEDKSFEQSGRSSLSSSVRTEGGVEESMESEVPFEISVDAGKSEQKDDYDIVHMDESTKQTSAQLDIDSLTNPARSPSPNVASDINVNKYLFSDDKDDDDIETEHSDTFSVDRYFAPDDATSVVDVSAVSNIENEVSVKKPSELQTTLDSPEENYDNIEYKEFSCPEKSEDVMTDEAVRCSPYVEVEPHHDEFDDEIVEKETGNVTLNDDDVVNVEHPKVSVPDEDASDPIAQINESDVLSTTSDASFAATNESVVAPAVSVSEQLNTAFEASVHSQPDIPERDYNINDDSVDGASFSAPTSEETELLETLEESKPVIIKAGVFTEQKPFKVRNSSISPQEKDAVRQNVVALYDQIAGESSNTNIPQTDSTDALPTDATFGVFGVTETLQSEKVNENTEAEVDDVTQPDEVQPPAKKEGWLVRVESFTAPKTKAPEIKIVQEAPGSPSESNPVSKERKKKKKKKNKGSKSQEENHDQSFQDSPTPSSPDLLGCSSGQEASASPSPSPRQQRSSMKDNSDIPQQFLDVSNELGESMSDVSDTEVGDDGIKKRAGSKRNSKKESCKTQ